LCRVDYYDPNVLKVLSNKQHTIYSSLSVLYSLQPGEKLLTCPFCNWGAIEITPLKELNFLHCGENTCQKITCLFCKKKVSTRDQDIHFECAAFSDLKNAISDIIETGFFLF